MTRKVYRTTPHGHPRKGWPDRLTELLHLVTPGEDDQTGLQNYHTGSPLERMTRQVYRITPQGHPRKGWPDRFTEVLPNRVTPGKDDQTVLQNYHTGSPQERMTRQFYRTTTQGHNTPGEDEQTGLQNYHKGSHQERMTRQVYRITTLGHPRNGWPDRFTELPQRVMPGKDNQTGLQN